MPEARSNVVFRIDIKAGKALKTNLAAPAGSVPGLSMDYNKFFSAALNRLHDERRYRVFADLERIAGRFPHAVWHSPKGKRDVVIWCSNDYLGMGQHPKVVGAMVETATRVGTGAGGTRNIAGTHHPLVQLEQELADLHGKEASLLFTSGYVSNQTGIATIAKLIPNCLILSDALNHNSMIEGVRQAGCERQIFRHSDMADLEDLLIAAGPDRPKLIACESLYSMDGDVAPLAKICDLAEKYGAMTYVDEGPCGRHVRRAAATIAQRDGVRVPSTSSTASPPKRWLPRRLSGQADALPSMPCACCTASSPAALSRRSARRRLDPPPENPGARSQAHQEASPHAQGDPQCRRPAR